MLKLMKARPQFPEQSQLVQVPTHLFSLSARRSDLHDHLHGCAERNCEMPRAALSAQLRTLNPWA
jgi:hypothetical protein